MGTPYITLWGTLLWNPVVLAMWLCFSPQEAERKADERKALWEFPKIRGTLGFLQGFL